MNKRESEETAETGASVVPGLGYPNNRLEASPEPTGWQGLDTKDIAHVSRETFDESTSR